jgi:hypothetical protein
MPLALARKPLPKPSPSTDPRFLRVMDQLKAGAAKTKAHPPASKKASEAAAAAKGPPNERAAAGKSRQVDKIKEAKEDKPKPASFLAMLRAEIDKAMPKTLGDTEKFMKGGSAEGMKSGLKGNVSQQKEQSTKDVSGAAKQTPAPAGEAKQETPLPKEGAAPPPNVNAPEAMPAPKTDAEVSLQDSKQETDAQMKEAEVTTPQLQKANDPRFSAVVDAKQKVAQNADAGPAKYRGAESATLTSAAAGASTAARVGAAAMLGVRAGSNTRVLTRQQQQKAADEAKRKAVVDKIESIYNATKERVEKKLTSLDDEVNGMFDRGVEAALAAMTKFVEDKLFAYKVRRYLSIPLVGLAAWVRDQFKGLPDEVNVFYEQGRALFQKLMDVVIVNVANLVELRLKEAKAEVAKGQAEIKAFVASQPRELQQVAADAAKNVADRFAELEKSIDDKKEQLANSLANKYKEAFDKANEALKKIQDENKGLVAGFMEKLGEVIKMLKEFRDRVMSLIKKGKETIDLIVADPIQFLKNLLAAIKGGISKFVDNIWTHLKKGFMAWLLGSLPPGIELPTDFSLPQILKLVLGVLGITYDRMRAKAVKLIGERNVKIIEKVVEYIRVLITGGPAALWEKVKEDLATLKQMVIDAIMNYLIETIVKQAIAKIVSMFNPVGAIIQAIIAIYNVVMFIIEKVQQILAFFEAIINSVHAIATGAISGAINWIEQALARTIPILIGFLARLLGLGGISKKVTEFITKIQNKVDKAIDKAIEKIVSVIKKLLGKGEKAGPGEPGTGDVKKNVEKDVNATLGSPITEGAEGEVQTKLSSIRSKYAADGLKRLVIVPARYADEFEVHAETSPGTKVGLIKTLLRLNPRDLDLRQPSTALTATLNTVELPPKRSNDKGHAEENLIRSTEPNLDEWFKKRPAAGFLLTVNINRSPCGQKTPDEPDNKNCANQLASFLARGRAIAAKYGKTFDMRLNIASLYGGETSGEGSPAQLALHEMIDAGIQIEGWDIVKGLEKKGVKNINAAAKKAKVREVLSRRVEAFKKVLKKIKDSKA